MKSSRTITFLLLLRLRRSFILLLIVAVSSDYYCECVWQTSAWSIPTAENNSNPRRSRRQILIESSSSATAFLITGGASATPSPANAAAFLDNNNSPPAKPSPQDRARSLLYEVRDPLTFKALAYSPPSPKTTDGDDNNKPKPPPLILVLHGAGKNTIDDVWEEFVVANPYGGSVGEHSGLIPSLIYAKQAPQILLNNFAVLAPYCGKGYTSFYELPRSRILQFVDWAASPAGKSAGCPDFDPSQIVVWGFSDGATVAVELLTSGKFQAGIICAYGYSGSKLPDKALERLANIPMWIFHSQDDVIFDVTNSDRLVEQLRNRVTTSNNINPLEETIKYSRYKSDPEGITDSRIRGHVSMGITSSKSSDVYEWILSQLSHSQKEEAQISSSNNQYEQYDGSVP